MIAENVNFVNESVKKVTQFSIDVADILMDVGMPQAVFVCAGTIIEGIGNAHSDLDCYIMCEELVSAREFDANKFTEVTNDNDEPVISDNDIVRGLYIKPDNTGFHIDIQFITYREMNKISEILNNAHAKLVDKRELYYSNTVLDTDYETNMFIHRLGCGVCVQGEWPKRSSIPKSDLYRDILYYESMPNFFDVKDIIGFSEAGSLWEAAYVGRKCLEQSLFNLTVAYGNTNKNKKWLRKKISDIPAAEVRKLAEYGIHMSGNIFQDEKTTEEDLREVLHLIDKINVTAGETYRSCNSGDWIDKQRNWLLEYKALGEEEKMALHYRKSVLGIKGDIY